VLTVADLVLFAVIALAALGGWARGLSRTVSRLAGFALGAIGGSWLAALVVSPTGSVLSRVVLDAACILGGALIGTAIGSRVGDAVGRLLRRIHLRLPDQAAGAVASAAAAVLVCWLVSGVVIGAGSPAVAAAVRGSAVLAEVSTVMPDRAVISGRIVHIATKPSALGPLLTGTGAPRP
jgi:uncharacterized membrane protein required for colicin V production